MISTRGSHQWLLMTLNDVDCAGWLHDLKACCLDACDAEVFEQGVARVFTKEMPVTIEKPKKSHAFNKPIPTNPPPNPEKKPKFSNLFNKKEKPKLIFGGSLHHQTTPTTPIPPVIRDCVREIDARGLDSVGIYRLSGNSTSIQKLKLQYDNGENVDLTGEMDINVCAGLLKCKYNIFWKGVTGFFSVFSGTSRSDIHV